MFDTVQEDEDEEEEEEEEGGMGPYEMWRQICEHMRSVPNDVVGVVVVVVVVGSDMQRGGQRVCVCVCVCVLS